LDFFFGSCESDFSLSAERSFHESINSSLTKNVEPVTEWSDLPCFYRTPDCPTEFSDDSILIEEMANDILVEVAKQAPHSPLYLVVLAIKTEKLPGEPPHLDFIQLRTKDRIYAFKVSSLCSRSDFLPSLRAILTNESIIKIGYGIRQSLQTISEAFSLPEIEKILKAKTAPILDLGKYAKLKGSVGDPSVSLHALSGVILSKSFSASPSFPYPWSTASGEQKKFLFDEIDCQWQIYIALAHRNSLGLPLQPIQAKKHGQLVTLVHGCKPVAEGSIIGHHDGYFNAVMDNEGNTRRINVSASRSLIEISKVRIPLFFNVVGIK